MGLREKAEINFKLAETLKSQGDYDAAANRFYYSVFQAVCFYAEQKLGYKWDDNTGKARLNCGKTGSAHSVIGWVVKEHYSVRREDFGDLLDYRKTADYDRNSINGDWLDSAFVHIVRDIKNHFLNRGV